MELPEQIYQDLTDQLPKIQEAIEQGVQYGGDLAMRFIKFDIAVQCVKLAACLALILTSLYLFKRSRDAATIAKEASDWRIKDSAETTKWATLCMGLLLIVIWVPLGLDATIIILKDIFIPEIRIIEVLSDLVNGGCTSCGT